MRSSKPVRSTRVWLCVAAAAVIAVVSRLAIPAEESPVKGIRTSDADMLCAANCMYLLCRVYDVPVGYEDIKFVLPPSESGVSMLSLKRIAEQLGFETRALEINPEDLLVFSRPMIVRETKRHEPSLPGHYVVLVPDQRNRGCWVFDPPKKGKFFPLRHPSPSEPDARIQILLLRPRVRKN